MCKGAECVKSHVLFPDNSCSPYAVNQIQFIGYPLSFAFCTFIIAFCSNIRLAFISFSLYFNIIDQFEAANEAEVVVSGVGCWLDTNTTMPRGRNDSEM